MSLRAALADLEEAVRLDPGSARAVATLSQCYLLAGTRDILTRDESYAKALAAATRALQLDDTMAKAHTQLAEVKFYYEWDWQAARRGYERALELNPNDSHALARYSQFLSALDESEPAIRVANLAQQLDPFSQTVRFAPGMALFYARRYDEAVVAFLHLAQVPQYALTASDRVGLARAYAARGQFAEAIQEMTTAIGQHERPLPIWLAELGRIHAAAGHRTEALKILKQLESQRNVIPAHIAFILIALGAADAGFEALNQAADDRHPALLWMHVDPRFDPVRRDPRLRDLALRIGVPQ